MGKEQFMQEYVLARVNRLTNSPFIPSIVKDAEEAWQLIDKAC